MAKSIFIMTVIILLGCAGICMGSEEGFQSTSGGITESLLKSDGPRGEKGSGGQGWEPLNKPAAPVKTRAIKVLKNSIVGCL